MRRAVGIDISGSSIKVAELIRSRGGVEIVSFFNEKLKDEEFPADLADVLREKVTSGARVISSVTSAQTILRSAVVPFSDERKIRQIVRFEAERYLPFPAEEAAVDFYVIGPEKAGDCRIMLVTVRKAFLEKHISLLKKLGVEPGAIDVDSMALLNLVPVDQRTVVLIDLGAEVTSISVISGGLPLCLRSVQVGGNNLTGALATAEKISWEEAEKKKVDAGVELPAFEESMVSIVNEVKYTTGAFSLQETGSKVEKILLSGGGGKLKNLPEFLEKKLSLDVVRFDPLRELNHGLDDDSVSGIIGCGDVAIGLALKGIGQKTAKVSVNLKKGLLKAKPRRKSFVAMLVLLSVTGFLAISTIFLRLHWKRVHLSRMDKQIRATFEQTFPKDRRKVRSSLEMISLMRYRVEEGRRQLGALGEIGTGSMLEMLSELTINIPDSVGVDITDLRLSRNSIRVEGEAGSFEEIKRLRENLSSSDYFTDVLVKEAVSLEGKVKFRLDITK